MQALPRSHCKIKLVAAKDNGWRAIRLDTAPGRTGSASPHPSRGEPKYLDLFLWNSKLQSF